MSRPIRAWVLPDAYEELLRDPQVHAHAETGLFGLVCACGTLCVRPTSDLFPTRSYAAEVAAAAAAPPLTEEPR